MSHCGIDFGAKKAGTTAVCFFDDSAWKIFQSSKNEDADIFLEKTIASLGPERIFIDAPLSLPVVYTSNVQPPEADYHYRVCDREAGAMSPLFLGGLTARAIRLRSIWAENGIGIFETYPKLLAHSLGLSAYKNDLATCMEQISMKLGLDPLPEMKNWHQADAFLAWISGLRHEQGRFNQLGNEKEGIIVY